MPAADHSPPTDSALVTRTIAGDDGAFRALVERYQGIALACARSITRSDADAADAAQEALIRFHRHLTQFDPDRPLRPYLLKIVANCSRNLIAARQRQRQADDADEHFARLPDPAPGPEAGILSDERRIAVQQLVAELPQTLREVCSLFYLAECSCREVAQTLRMSETAVKVSLHRARAKLRTSEALKWRTT